jgi:hypothetical protein
MAVSQNQSVAQLSPTQCRSVYYELAWRCQTVLPHALQNCICSLHTCRDTMMAPRHIVSSHNQAPHHSPSALPPLERQVYFPGCACIDFPFPDLLGPAGRSRGGDLGGLGHARSIWDLNIVKIDAGKGTLWLFDSLDI